MSTSSSAPQPTDLDEPVNTPPYIFVVTPLMIFIFVGILATIVRVRRRNRMMATGRWPPPEPYFGTPPADGTTSRRVGPEGAWIPVVVRGPGPRRGERGRGRRNADGALTVRTEEGLNELGEAPPPYDPKAQGGFKDVELGELERGAGFDPPGYGVVNTGERRLGSNNPYVASVRDEGGEGSEVRAPAPAVTR
jgi:hypothetical protein